MQALYLFMCLINLLVTAKKDISQTNRENQMCCVRLSTIKSN